MKHPLMFAAALALALTLQPGAKAATVNLTIVNSGFEANTAPVAAATGWTLTAGGYFTTAGTGLNPIDPTSGQGGSAQFLTADRLAVGAGSSPSSVSAFQDINVSAYAASIDANLVTTNIGFWYNGNDPNDDAKLTISFFNAANGLISSTTTARLATTPANTWVSGTVAGGLLAVPANTRTLRIALLAIRGTGTVTNINWDNITASLSGIPAVVVPTPAAMPAGLALLTLLSLRRRK